jgi:hypothetical protein
MGLEKRELLNDETKGMSLKDDIQQFWNLEQYMKRSEDELRDARMKIIERQRNFDREKLDALMKMSEGQKNLKNKKKTKE